MKHTRENDQFILKSLFNIFSFYFSYLNEQLIEFRKKTLSYFQLSHGHRAISIPETSNN